MSPGGQPDTADGMSGASFNGRPLPTTAGFALGATVSVRAGAAGATGTAGRFTFGAAFTGAGLAGIAGRIFGRDTGCAACRFFTAPRLSG